PRASLPPEPPLNVPGFLALAHLEASIRYEYEFNDSGAPLQFKDSQGRVTPVWAFGIRAQDEDQGNDTFRDQVRVLFREGKEFAVDLSRKTQPYQIVIARMGRKATLQATLADLEKRVAGRPREGKATDLGAGAILLVPNMNWRIEHRFLEL